MQISAYKIGMEVVLEDQSLVSRGHVMAVLAAILNLVWRRQVLRFLAFLASYLALLSKYGTWCVHPLIATLKLAVMRFPAQPSLTSEAQPDKKSVEPPKPQDSVHCQVLHDPGFEARTVDVIFIHGLHGSLRNTWRQGDWGRRNNSPVKRVLRSRRARHEVPGNQGPHDSEPYAHCWPKEWLPKDCPGARIIALDYTTDPYLWRPVWITKQHRTCIVQRSREMARQLRSLGVGERPLVWVAHSKGGLFVKQMLVDAWESEGSAAELCRTTRGIMFYSVPHRGSALALIDPPLLRQSVELIEVKKDSPQVLDLHARFLRLCEQEEFRVELVSFFETKLTLLSVIFLRIVSPESADPDIGELCGVHLDHRQICKPRSRNCFLYRSLTELIERVV